MIRSKLNEVMPTQIESLNKDQFVALKSLASASVKQWSGETSLKDYYDWAAASENTGEAHSSLSIVRAIADSCVEAGPDGRYCVKGDALPGARI